MRKLLVVLLLYCFQSVNAQVQLNVLEYKTLKGVPSASGISINNDSIFVIGDNTPYLFQIDESYKIVSKTVIQKLESETDTLFPKSIKPDFEAIDLAKIDGKNELLIFGSGSKSPYRDVLYISDNKFKTFKNYSLEYFYDKIKSSKELDGNFLNIEGVAIDGDNLFIFNRGKNLMFHYSLKAFLNYVKTGKNYPTSKIYELHLPKIKGIEAGLSGATAIFGENKLLFTASIEDTSNPIDDGEVLGSFVGIIDLNELKNDYTPQCVQIKQNDKDLKIKVESVSIKKKISANNAEILLVTDSDGGNSEILKCDLKY